jgi:hypothetical protein
MKCIHTVFAVLSVLLSVHREPDDGFSGLKHVHVAYCYASNM